MGVRRATRLRHFRRTVCTGVVVAAAVAGVAAVGASSAAGAPRTPAQAAAEFNRGTGSALAESIRLDPVAGGLSFGIGVGESLAGHQNSGATAESRAANLGVIGTTMAAEGCDGGEPTMPREDQPQPLRAQSGEEGAEEGKSGQDPKVPGVDRFVRATTDPFAEALTSGSNLEIPGVLSVQGARSFASSGVINGDTREAIARTEIGRLAFAGGQIEIRDLVWEAVHRTGAVDEQVGTFTIGAITVGGQAVPMEDPTQGLSEANAALAPLGLQIRPPRVHYDETARGTLATVDPLGIRVVPAPARDQVLGGVLGGVQPVRQELFQALIDYDCGNATYITVLDIVLNAFGAGGYFAVELGGVQASTAEINRFSGLGVSGAGSASIAGVTPASGASTSSGSALPGSSGVASSGAATGGATTPAAPAGGSAAGETPIDDAVETAAEGRRGGALAGVAGGGLLLLLATAEGDRRKMRRAMREIPLEA
jgi:hypothetical protein